MPRQLITSVVDDKGRKVWPLDEAKPKGDRVVSKQAAYIITDILSGNTDPRVNPYWAEWAVYDGGRRRPAAYKTGTTSDNVDVHAYGYLAPPKDKEAPALAIGVWMGNSNNEPNRGSLSLDSSAPLWSAITTAVSKDLPVANFRAPGRPEDGDRGCVHRSATGAVHPQDGQGAVPARAPCRASARRSGSRVEVDKASGLLWQDGCVGPKVTKGFFDLSEVESNFPAWQKANRNWAARAARGTGVRGTSKGTRTSYFYTNGFAPFGRSWGAPFAPTKKCPHRRRHRATRWPRPIRSPARSPTRVHHRNRARVSRAMATGTATVTAVAAGVATTIRTRPTPNPDRRG